MFQVLTKSKMWILMYVGEHMRAHEKWLQMILRWPSPLQLAGHRDTLLQSWHLSAGGGSPAVI